MLEALPLDTIEKLSPHECADLLLLTSREEFVSFMRRTLPSEEARAFTDADLYALHEAMCERLRAKAGAAVDSWEGTVQAGQA